MDKVNVLYVIDMFYGKGGAEKNLLQLVKGVDRSRYLPYVLCLHHGKMLTELRKEGIDGRDLRLERIYGLKGLAEAVKLFAFIIRRRIKVVVTYHESSDFWGGMVARLAGVPVVISNRRDMGYKLKPRHILMYRLINRFFDRIIVVSEAVRDVVAQKQHVLWSKLVTVYNGVETDIPVISSDEKERLRASLGLSEKKWLVVGMTGSVRSIKGHRFLIAAASIVVKEFPGVYFLVMGSFDDPQYLSQLRDMARALNVDKNVIFCGHKSNIFPYIQIMDLCVSASLSEGMSNAVLEYMACGRPVVATRVGGNGEVVEHGVTGLLVPPQDAVSLASAITAMLKDPALREKMGAAGKKAACERFSVPTMLRKIGDLYARLLEERGPGIFRSTFGSFGNAIRRGIKQGAGSAMHYSGITVFLRAASGPGIRVLAYHRVADSWFDPLSMCLPVGLFEQNLMHIRREYVPFALDEALYLLREGKRIPDKALALTFDDGYEDNLSNAVPLLARYRIPATVFINVNAVEEGEPIWHDRVVEAFRGTSRGRLDLRPHGLGVFDISTIGRKMKCCRRLIIACQRVPNAGRKRLVDAIVEALTGKPSLRRLMLDWDEVRRLVSRGFALGSHGMNHYALRTLSLAEVDYEAGESKRLIRERAGVDVQFFANPFGNPGDFNDDTIGVLRRNGYAAAFVLARGVNSDPLSFTFGRYCISPGIITGLAGMYSPRVFDMQMAIPYRLPRRAMPKTVETALR